LSSIGAVGESKIYITLPTGADFTGGTCLLAGTSASEYGAAENLQGVVPGRIYADPTNTRAIVEFETYISGISGSRSWVMSVHFTYLIV
jgi:hypothetical protein